MSYLPVLLSLWEVAESMFCLYEELRESTQLHALVF